MAHSWKGRSTLKTWRGEWDNTLWEMQWILPCAIRFYYGCFKTKLDDTVEIASVCNLTTMVTFLILCQQNIVRYYIIGIVNVCILYILTVHAPNVFSTVLLYWDYFGVKIKICWNWILVYTMLCSGSHCTQTDAEFKENATHRRSQWDTLICFDSFIDAIY